MGETKKFEDCISIKSDGVFADAKIPKNTILICDVFLVGKDELLFKEYSYPWTTKHNAVCAGFGSFLNYSETANVSLLGSDRKNLTLSFKVLKPINKGEELTINLKH
jgi:hypothetical protein